ncbi:DUF488 domain-containing protein [Selenomonas sp. KH1T6]|uniref:DUF488 domain-containing protein n=1 Tax=Selenomonas sp. KH1T6 TaxID=3158784 RepID=UPI0008A7F6D6|nr:Uncharacterized conserved protein YeaO, DUF488 family [Selenomonas ruminantium]
MEHELLLKRVYEPCEPQDGYRILVDRLWPRGIKKEAAQLDEWAKVITPSTEIRRLYHRGDMPFEGFSQAYLEELETNEAAETFVSNCSEQLKSQNVTLVYAAKNDQENHALVLREWLRRKMAGGQYVTY